MVPRHPLHRLAAAAAAPAAAAATEVLAAGRQYCMGERGRHSRGSGVLAAFLGGAKCCHAM